MSNELPYRIRTSEHPRAGNTSITTTAAGVPASVTVTFAPPFAAPPIVNANPLTSVPGTVVSAVGVASVTETSAVLWVTRSVTGTTGIHWTAAPKTQ